MRVSLVPTLELTLTYGPDDAQEDREAMYALAVRECRELGYRMRMVSCGVVPVKPGSPRLSDKTELVLRMHLRRRQSWDMAIRSMPLLMARIANGTDRIRNRARSCRRRTNKAAASVAAPAQ